jgi:hypothetical protein
MMFNVRTDFICAMCPDKAGCLLVDSKGVEFD